jgi:phosphatase NudJ
MALYSHNIYENVRTRILVIHNGCVLLLPPHTAVDAYGPPGGGLEAGESLAECAAREVLEETGLTVEVGRVAFLREWVVPTYFMPDDPAEVQRAPAGDGHAYGLEVFFYAVPLGDPFALRQLDIEPVTAEWVPLERVPSMRVWPNELKSLAVTLLRNGVPGGAPSFVGELDDPGIPARDVPWLDTSDVARAGRS